MHCHTFLNISYLITVMVTVIIILQLGNEDTEPCSRSKSRVIHEQFLPRAGLDESPKSKVEQLSCPRNWPSKGKGAGPDPTNRTSEPPASVCLHTTRWSCYNADSNSVDLDSILSRDLSFAFLARSQKMPVLLDYRPYFQYQVLVDLPEVFLWLCISFIGKLIFSDLLWGILQVPGLYQ